MREMQVVIRKGAGRHGKSWEVSLKGAHGYSLHSFITAPNLTLEEVKGYAAREYGSLANSAEVKGGNTLGTGNVSHLLPELPEKE